MFNQQSNRLHAIIHGKVQGVAYRAHTQREAIALGLAGWVRNCSDGTVELLAEGGRAKLDALLQWCHKGPPAASVLNIEVQWLPATGEFKEFVIRR